MIFLRSNTQDKLSARGVPGRNKEEFSKDEMVNKIFILAATLAFMMVIAGATMDILKMEPISDRWVLTFMVTQIIVMVKFFVE
jgi:hypothetical protein